MLTNDASTFNIPAFINSFVYCHSNTGTYIQRAANFIFKPFFLSFISDGVQSNENREADSITL